MWLIITSTPVIYSYFYKELLIFDYLTFFEVFSIVYLFFSLISIISTRGRTIGYNLMKLELLDIKTGRINILKNILRVILISISIFLIGGFEDINYSMLTVSIFLITPFPIPYKDKVFYSAINRLLGLI